MQRDAQTIVSVTGASIKETVSLQTAQHRRFLRRDGGTVFTEIVGVKPGEGVRGLVEVADCSSAPGAGIDPGIGVVVTVDPQISGSSTEEDAAGWGAEGLRAYVAAQGHWRECSVRVIPVKEELFSRNAGLIESDLLANANVGVFGVSSVGAPVAIMLAQSGVTRFFLMDHDRLEVCNVVRHDAGVSDVGRYKTRYMADRIRDKNPYAQIDTYEEKLTGDNKERVREVVRNCDLIISAMDEREGKLLLNRLCVEERKTCIVAGAFRRAYGGQILRVRPYESLCYQCFLKLLPDAGGQTSGPDFGDAPPIAYSDRPVPIEPGLSIDIAPINHMAAKLAVQELLRGKETTLRSLDDDLSASWYWWLNRREVDTQYQDLGALGCRIDGVRVCRWYGVDAPRDPECPACGDFAGALAKREGIELSPQALAEAEQLLGRLG